MVEYELKYMITKKEHDRIHNFHNIDCGHTTQLESFVRIQNNTIFRLRTITDEYHTLYMLTVKDIDSMSEDCFERGENEVSISYEQFSDLLPMMRDGNSYETERKEVEFTKSGGYFCLDKITYHDGPFESRVEYEVELEFLPRNKRRRVQQFHRFLQNLDIDYKKSKESKAFRSKKRKV